MKCVCFGGERPVEIPDPRTGGRSGLAMKYTNPDCPVHGKKKAKKKGDA